MKAISILGNQVRISQFQNRTLTATTLLFSRQPLAATALATSRPLSTAASSLIIRPQRHPSPASPIMTLSLGMLGTSRTPRVEDYDSSSSTESADTARNYTAHSRSGTAFAVSTSTTGPLGSPVFLFPPTSSPGRSSRSSTSSNTPVPSRSVSPLPQFYSSGPSSSCTSDTDSEPHSPILGRQYRNASSTEDRRRWWTLGTSTRRRRKRHGRLLRLLKKIIRRLVRHPLFPSQPITIVSMLQSFPAVVRTY
jgi:hypothetical protein